MAMLPIVGGLVALVAYKSKVGDKKIKGIMDDKKARVQSSMSLSPYLPFQFQTIKDIIYSQELESNEFRFVDKTESDGIYGMTQQAFRMNGCQPVTLVYRSENLIK